MKTKRVTIDSDRLHWFKSSYSGSGGGNCVEVATTPAAVRVRDSKDVDGPILRFSPEEWSAFVSYARELPGV